MLRDDNISWRQCYVGVLLMMIVLHTGSVTVWLVFHGNMLY